MLIFIHTVYTIVAVHVVLMRTVLNNNRAVGEWSRCRMRGPGIRVTTRYGEFSIHPLALAGNALRLPSSFKAPTIPCRASTTASIKTRPSVVNGAWRVISCPDGLRFPSPPAPFGGDMYPCEPIDLLEVPVMRNEIRSGLHRLRRDPDVVRRNGASLCA